MPSGVQYRWVPVNPNMDKSQFLDNSKSYRNHTPVSAMLICFIPNFVSLKEFYLTSITFFQINQETPVFFLKDPKDCVSLWGSGLVLHRQVQTTFENSSAAQEFDV